MASFISSRERIGFWLVASRVAAVAGVVLALVGAWHGDAVTARSNAALVPNARAPWPALTPLDDQSLDEGEVAAPLEAEGVSQIHPSLSPSPFETINLTSGNLALIIPLLHLPGNGLIDLDVTLSLNTKHWMWRIGPGVVLEGASGGPKVISADGTPLGFKVSSQQRTVRLSIGDRQEPPRVSSSRGSCGDGC